MSKIDRDFILISLDEISFILKASLNTLEVNDTVNTSTGIILAMRSVDELKARLEEKSNDADSSMKASPIITG